MIHRRRVAVEFAGAFVNQAGRPHPLMPFVGPSFVLDRRGRVVARSQDDREGILPADIEAPPR